MNAKLDKVWFVKKLAENRTSLRSLARVLKIDASAASRMLSGARKMRMDEANTIASFLNVPVAEVLRHAGVALDGENTLSRVLLAATVDENGQVRRLSKPRPLPQGVINRAVAALRSQGDATVIAAQIRAETGPLAMLDDSILLFHASEIIEETAIGSLAICRTYEGDQCLAKIESARKTGEVRVVVISGKSKEMVLQTASPILAIIP
jgi:hypothetical protein